MSDLNLEDIWANQGFYNAAVRQRQERSEPEWMETYILGLVSEAGQLLDSMRWKRHKLQSLEDFSPNVPQELADLTKYIFSMWQLLGYTPQQMLEEVDLKSRFLQQMFTQDFSKQLHTNVVIFDLDDVLSDHREGLSKYMQLRFSSAERKVVQDSEAKPDIHLDTSNGWRFDEYREAKNQFEVSGGYRTLKPMYEVKWLFDFLASIKISTVVWTARPINVFRRIALDTFMWFEDRGCQPDMLRFGREERILHACELREQGHNVIFVEDNADLSLRMWNLGFETIIPYREHNKGYANFDGSSEDLLLQINRRIEKYGN